MTWAQAHLVGREARSGRERQCGAADRRDGGRSRHRTS